jgi:hypothetical protein
MKVFQLMTLLESAKAGADVVVGSEYTFNAHITSVEISKDGTVQLTSCDTALIDKKGNPLGLLSKLSKYEPEETP